MWAGLSRSAVLNGQGQAQGEAVPISPVTEPLNSESLLVVCPADFQRDLFADLPAFFLEYQFVSEHPADGFAAWSREEIANGEKVEVADRCRPLQAGFGQQALNRLFAQRLLRVRPGLVVVVGLSGCTGDLPRVADMMDVPALLLIDDIGADLSSLDRITYDWLRDSFARCKDVIDFSGGRQRWPESWNVRVASGTEALRAIVRQSLEEVSVPTYRFDYSTYEFCQRDHPLLFAMQAPDAAHFAGCEQVLDLGCGAGIFLDCLRREGIKAQGVERDPRIAEYGRGLGLDIVTADAIDFLARDSREFDGIYCSHFVEHLPFDALQTLFERIAARLRAGGILVLVFPDPESIRSQLLGFWRDPEHVRFYHPDLIAGLAGSVGLEVEWSSHQAQPHRVVPFPAEPPAIGPVETPPLAFAPRTEPVGWVEKLLSGLGLAHRRQLARLEEALQSSIEALQQASRQQERALSRLGERTATLWDVNLTWAWNDNATMRLKKRGEEGGEHTVEASPVS